MPVSARNAASSVSVFGLLFQFRRRALRHDGAVVDDGDAVGDAVGFFHVMRGEEDGDALFFVEFLHLRPELVARLRVEAERRLVEKDDFGRVEQAARDFQTPPHAAGELLDRIVAAVPELEQLQQAFDAFDAELCAARR